MTNPIIHPLLFAIYLAFILTVGGSIALLCYYPWQREQARIRQAILEELGLADDDAGQEEARQRILALLPCTGRRLEGRFDDFPDGERLWVCFLEDRLLLVSAGVGDVVSLPLADIRKLFLVDRPEGGTRPVILQAEGGFAQLDFERLDDLVRLVNVLVRQGIVLKYTAEGE